MAITFRQTNPANRTSVHNVTQMVISPLSAGNFFQEIQQTGSIREFLFEMTKDGIVYWVGAAVPQGTSDFTKAQVFFHPTILQNGVWVATEGDYPAFTGGWSRSLQRYVAMQGGQLAGARQTTLIVPFMTMSAIHGMQPAYMFGSRPVATLEAIMTAVRDAATQPSSTPVQVARIGVSSFSSGISAMRTFVHTFGGSGLIVETTDFDSPVIVGSQQAITRSPGAHGRVFSQVGPPRPLNGWTTMRPLGFRNIHSYRNYHEQWQRVHAQIGWMTFYLASLGSVLP